MARAQLKNLSRTSDLALLNQQLDLLWNQKYGGLTEKDIRDGAVSVTKLNVENIVADGATIAALTAAILNVSTVNSPSGTINFLMTKESLAAFIRFSTTLGIEIGRNGSRYKSIVSDTGFTVFRDTQPTTQVTDTGLSADAIKAIERFLVGDGATIEYNSAEGLSLLLS